MSIWLRAMRVFVVTVSFLMAFLILSPPAMAEEKSPAESQVDKANKFWDQMEGFTEEPGMQKDKSPEQKPAEEKTNTVEKLEKPVAEPVVAPPPAPSPRPATTVQETPLTEKRPVEAAPKIKSASTSEETTKKNKETEQYLDQGIMDIASDIAESIPSGKTTTIAVVDFNDLQGNVTKLGRYISEELITQLFQDKRFRVIERGLLEKAIDELKFNATDLVNPDAAQQLGKVVGAEAIVTGTLTDIGRLIKANARVIRTETGEVIGAAGTRIIKTLNVEDMMKEVLGYSKGKSKGASGVKEESRSAALQKYEAKGYLFELQGCESSSQMVTCNLTITNTGKDRDLSIGYFRNPGITKMFDDRGYEHNASGYKLLEQVSNDGRKSVGKFLVSGIPVNASIKFEGVSSEATQISVLTIQCAYPEDSRRFTVQFRDIPISRAD